MTYCKRLAQPILAFGLMIGASLSSTVAWGNQCFQISDGLGMAEMGVPSHHDEANFSFGCERVRKHNEYAALMSHNALAIHDDIASVSFENGLVLYSHTLNGMLQLASGFTALIQTQLHLAEGTDIRFAAAGGIYAKSRVNSPWPMSFETTYRFLPATTNEPIIHTVAPRAVYQLGTTEIYMGGLYSPSRNDWSYHFGLRL